MKVRQKLQTEGNAVAGSPENPPGILVSGSSPAKAPVADGGFSYSDEEPQRYSWLPPREYWTWDGEKFQVPVDHLGFIAMNEVISLVKSTVAPEYAWMRGRAHENIHHDYFEDLDYQYLPGITFSPAVFRQLPINKHTLPKDLHGMLHTVMEKPVRPAIEVMDNRVRAYKATKNLFDSARKIIKWERKSVRREGVRDSHPDIARPKRLKDGTELINLSDIEYIIKVLERQDRGVSRHIEELERVPAEFRLIEPASTPRQLARQLEEIGRLVVPQSVKVGRLLTPDKQLGLAA
jgi:hypothetical protein